MYHGMLLWPKLMLEQKNCCLNYVDTVSGYWEAHKTMETRNNNYCLE